MLRLGAAPLAARAGRTGGSGAASPDPTAQGARNGGADRPRALDVARAVTGAPVAAAATAAATALAARRRAPPARGLRMSATGGGDTGWVGALAVRWVRRLRLMPHAWHKRTRWAAALGANEPWDWPGAGCSPQPARKAKKKKKRASEKSRSSVCGSSGKSRRALVPVRASHWWLLHCINAAGGLHTNFTMLLFLTLAHDHALG